MARVKGTASAPTVLKVLRGGHPERINTDEPVPQEGIPQCPTPDPEVREVWDYMAVQLSRMRTLTMADRDALHTYCEQVVVHRHAADIVREHGELVESPRGWMKNPAIAVLHDSATQIRAIGREFGLTPAARTAIKVADQQAPSQKQDPSRLLSG